MKIILSVQPIKYPLTGIGRYTYELAKELENINEIRDLKYIINDRIVDGIPKAPDHETKYKSTQIDRLKRFAAKNKFILDAYRRYKNYSATDPFRHMENSIYHGPNFYIPKFPGTSVVTIHDLSVFTMPDFHPRERVLYLSREIEASLARATMIVTDSDYIKAEIISHFDVPEDRVGVAKLACGQEFHPRSAQDSAIVLKAYGLKYQSYTLYAGTIEPRKNLSALLEAYSRLPLHARQHNPLVLAGYKGWNNADIMTEIDRGRREGWIKYLGFVPNDELPVLYAAARLFAFPSLYEGFGLPVLEAMASGVPVVTSDRSSLPEVGGRAALYTNPDDVESMTQHLERGLFDDGWRDTAIMDGVGQASHFSWRQCAEDTVAVYRTALDRSAQLAST